MALMIGCIWHGLDALQGTRAKPGNHLVPYKLAWNPLCNVTYKDMVHRCSNVALGFSRNNFQTNWKTFSHRLTSTGCTGAASPAIHGRRTCYK